MASVFAVLLAFVAVLTAMELHSLAAMDANTQRNINIVEFEMKMLHQTIMKKHAALSKLRGCATTIQTVYNGSSLQEDNTGIDPYVKTLSEVKKYTELEKHLYIAIIQKMKVLYPSDIPLDDSETSRESLRSLSKPLDVMKESEHTSQQQCHILEFEDSYQRCPSFVRKFPACSRILCSISDFTVLPDGSLVFVDWGRRRIMRKSETGRGRAMLKVRLGFPPSTIAYFKPNTVLIETVPRRERMFYAFDLETGEQEEMTYSIYRGVQPYNMVVIDGKVIVGGKSGGGMHVYNNQSRRNHLSVYSRIRNQYDSLIPFEAENGSPFFLLGGTMLKDHILLVGATGERICTVKKRYNTYGYEGVVRRNGNFLLVYLTIDRTVVVKWYNTECHCTGYHILHKMESVTNVALVNDTLIIASDRKEFHVYSI